MKELKINQFLRPEGNSSVKRLTLSTHYLISLEKLFTIGKITSITYYISSIHLAIMIIGVTNAAILIYYIEIRKIQSNII